MLKFVAEKSSEMEETARRAGALHQKISDLIETLPDGDANGFQILLALAWCAGNQIGLFPDEVRELIRDIAWDEINGVVKVMEEEGVAGTIRMHLTN